MNADAKMDVDESEPLWFMRKKQNGAVAQLGERRVRNA